MFRTRSRIHTALPSTCQVCIPHKHAQAAACTDTLESCWECDSIKLYEIRIYKSKYASTYLYSNVWYIISYLFYNALTIVLYLSKSFKIYSNNLGAHWISMVSSYQWWSAKIPRKKSKRPIAMQPCPKSDQDSIPPPVKSLVFLMQWTSWPKGSGNDILLAIYLIRSAATCFVNFFPCQARLKWWHVIKYGVRLEADRHGQSYFSPSMSFSSGELISAPAPEGIYPLYPL